MQIRRSSRLVLLDPEGCLLLFKYQDEHQPPFWSTVGGELQEGEDYLAAAARELAEETGVDAAIGPVVKQREDVYAVARSTPARWIERYFLVPCSSAFTPNNSRWTEEERETIQHWRWWSLDEMQETAERFLPTWLPDLLATTLAGDEVRQHGSSPSVGP